MEGFGEGITRLSTDRYTGPAEHEEIFEQQLAKLEKETGGAISSDRFSNADTFAVSERTGPNTVKVHKAGSFGEVLESDLTENFGGTPRGTSHSFITRSASIGGTFRIEGVGVRTLTGPQLMRHVILHEFQHQIHPGLTEAVANLRAWEMGGF